MLYAGDLKWWQNYSERVKRNELPRFERERWTVTMGARARYGCQYIKGRQGAGLSRTPGVINLGGNSGYAAVGLAVHWGAARIVLLGYDMQRTRHQSHWHGDHPRGMGNPSNFPGWVKRFRIAARDLAELGVVVVNATRQTALDCFPRVSLHDALHGETT